MATTIPNKAPAMNEPVVAYQKSINDASLADKWNPNVPFNGTQEEWWEHFQQIEGSPFYAISDVHQRVSLWLDNQEK